MTEIEKLLLDFLHIESITGNEKKFADKVAEKLEGFDVKKQWISKTRYNIIAKKGKSKTWIVAHLDTVPGVVPSRELCRAARMS